MLWLTRLGNSYDPFLVIGSDLTEERVAWSNPQVRQRNDESFLRAPRRRDIAHNPTLIAKVEDTLDEEHPIRTDLQPLVAE